MKPTPRADLYLVFRDQRDEVHEGLPRDIHAGIYVVLLNHGPSSVTFVPQIDDLDAAWPPSMPADLDDLGSKREARLAALATSGYAVTPSQERAGRWIHSKSSSRTSVVRWG